MHRNMIYYVFNLPVTLSQSHGRFWYALIEISALFRYPFIHKETQKKEHVQNVT